MRYFKTFNESTGENQIHAFSDVENFYCTAHSYFLNELNDTLAHEIDEYFRQKYNIKDGIEIVPEELTQDARAEYFRLLDIDFEEEGEYVREGHTIIALDFKGDEVHIHEINIENHLHPLFEGREEWDGNTWEIVPLAGDEARCDLWEEVTETYLWEEMKPLNTIHEQTHSTYIKDLPDQDGQNWVALHEVSRFQNTPSYYTIHTAEEVAHLL